MQQEESPDLFSPAPDDCTAWHLMDLGIPDLMCLARRAISVRTAGMQPSLTGCGCW